MAEQAAAAKVYVLRDMRQLQALPTDLKLTKQMAARTQASKIAFVAMVDPNRLMRFMIEATKTQAALNSRVFASCDEAETFLRDLAAAD